MDRRKFLIGVGLTLFTPPTATASRIIRGGLERLASLEYENIKASPPAWEEIQKGIYFTRMEISRGSEVVDRVAIVKVSPQDNKLRVFTDFESKSPQQYSTIEGWQQRTGASIIFNSAQYQANPNYGAPVALSLSDGKRKGPSVNRFVRGMLIGEPKDAQLPLIDLLDFQYDTFDVNKTPYTEGVQHWPILLNREGKIRVKKTDWQANRTVVAKNREHNLLVMVTERGFFTLYNFARFLKDSRLNIHTAMNLDGGYEACMSIKTPKLNYVTYGQFETYGPQKNVSVLGARIGLPNTVGIFPRN